MRQPAMLAVVMLGLIFTACGGDDSPAAPTPVIPTVQGIWTGDYSVVTCNDQTAAGFCNAAGFTSGRVLPIRIVLNQTGQQLTGTVELGSVGIPVTGTVTAAGRMVLNGSTTTPLGGFSTTFTLVNWDTSVAGQNMTGGWRTTIGVSGVSGNVFIDNTIRLLAKTG